MLHCQWEAAISGPAGSPYAGGVFRLRLDFPPGANEFAQYPFKPPRARFITPIYHRLLDSEGNIVVKGRDAHILGGWGPARTVYDFVSCLAALLKMSRPELNKLTWSPIEECDWGEYERRARECTRYYAT
jgi:ubiquitin-protein ligase